MVSQLQVHYLDDIADKLISYYEKQTNKKFNTRDLDSCIEFIKWLNGDVVFCSMLNDRYGINGAVVNKSDDSFVVFVDQSSFKSNIDIEKNVINIIYRMLWFHIRTWVTEKNMSDEEKQTNRLVYPKMDGLTVDELLALPEIKVSDSIQNSIIFRKRLTNKH